MDFAHFVLAFLVAVLTPIVAYLIEKVASHNPSPIFEWKRLCASVITIMLLWLFVFFVMGIS